MPGASLAAGVPPEPPCFNHTPQTAGVGPAAGCWHPWPARGGRGKAKQIREGATMRKPVSMKALEKLGRIRLSPLFFMRDMLYSKIANFHGIPNILLTGSATRTSDTSRFTRNEWRLLRLRAHGPGPDARRDSLRIGPLADPEPTPTTPPGRRLSFRHSLDP